MSANQKQFTPLDNLIRSNLSKEQEPASAVFETQTVVEDVVDPEVKQFVEIRKERVQIDPELKKLGVERSDDEYGLSLKQKTVVLPISDAMVMKGLHASITSSLRWLAEWAEYLLKKAHITLKRIHGHVVRMVKK